MKKLITACLALVALAAFALPAAASATNEPTLTENGADVAVNSKILATNIGNTVLETTSGSPLVTCTTAKLTGKVLVNANGQVVATIETATFAGTGPVHPDTGDKECTGSFGNATVTVKTPLCIESDPSMLTDEFEVFGDDCNSPLPNSVTFTILSTTAGECKYETTLPVSGGFTTDPEEAVLTVDDDQLGSGAKKEAGGFLCPSSGMLEMSFELETDVSPFTKLTIS
jgi:hypothetical protein